MAIYYDDLVLAGTYYKPPVFGQNATPGWADDIVYVAPFISTPTPPTPDDEATQSGGGGIDPGGLRAVKPLGLPARKPLRDERTVREIHEEVVKETAESFGVSESTPTSFRPIESMSMGEIHDEIRQLLLAKVDQDEERLLILLIAMAS